MKNAEIETERNSKDVDQSVESVTHCLALD